MKRKTYLSFALGFLLLPLPNTLPKEEKPSPLPEQISRYYDRYSFVSSFSTRQERNQLMACLKGQELLGQPGYIRLKKILDLMKELQTQVQSIDPKMVIPPCPAVYIDYSGVVEIKSISVSDERAMVQVTIYGLEPEANIWLIAQYDQSGGDEQKLPSPGKRLNLARASTFERTEFHIWAKLNEEWKKSEANLILLKN